MATSPHQTRCEDWPSGAPAILGPNHVTPMRPAEMEMIDRKGRMVERRIKAAKFPTVKSVDSFDFLALPSLNKMLALELARSDCIERRENIITVGNSECDSYCSSLHLL
jgi:DNA replication protein DnaC